MSHISTEQATRPPGSWFTTGYAIYQIDELGNPGRLLAQASTLLVANSMVEAHNSMLAALKETAQYFEERGVHIKVVQMVDDAIAKATGGE